MHGHIPGSKLTACIFDHHANPGAMQIGRQFVTRGKPLEPAKTHVLTNLADQAFAHVFQGRTKTVLCIGQGPQCGKIGGIVLRNQQGTGVGQCQEAVVLGNEISFTVHFKQRSDGTVNETRDDAFGGNSSSSLAGFAAEFHTQQFFSLCHVTLRLGQRTFALHHGRVSLATQFSNHARGNCSHFDSPYSIHKIKKRPKKGARKPPLLGIGTTQTAVSSTSTNSSAVSAAMALTTSSTILVRPSMMASAMPRAYRTTALDESSLPGIT